MSQGVLGFKYEEERHETGMTGLAGLPVYLDLIRAMGLRELIGRHLRVKARGWTDAQVVLSLVLLNLAGGDCVEDLRKLEKDEGFCRILRRVEQSGLKRSDTAGYQHSLLRYCNEGQDSRFGRIEFSIGADVTSEFKKAVLREVDPKDWKPLYAEFEGKRIRTGQEWAEVCFIPTVIGHRLDAPVYRYLAIREPLGSMDLPGMPQQAFPFQTVQMDLQQYKLFSLVTNMDWEGEQLIHWHRERCGKSEEAHGVMKGDFAGGKLPAGDF